MLGGGRFVYASVARVALIKVCAEVGVGFDEIIVKLWFLCDLVRREYECFCRRARPCIG
jgi:hypothetical protein